MIMFFDAIQSLGQSILLSISYMSVCHCEGCGFQAVQSEIELKLDSLGLK